MVIENHSFCRQSHLVKLDFEFPCIQGCCDVHWVAGLPRFHHSPHVVLAGDPARVQVPLEPRILPGHCQELARSRRAAIRGIGARYCDHVVLLQHCNFDPTPQHQQGHPPLSRRHALQAGTGMEVVAPCCEGWAPVGCVGRGHHTAAVVGPSLDLELDGRVPGQLLD